MSETSQGEGWWLASDGKWYGPEPGPSGPSQPEARAGRPFLGTSEAASKRPSLLIVVGAVVVALAALVIHLVSTSGTPITSEDQTVMSAYEQTCTGGYSTGVGSVEDNDPIPGLIGGVQCKNGDAIGAYSTLMVFSSSSGASAAQGAFPTNSYGYTCFVVGPDWLMAASGEIGRSSAIQDAQAEQSRIGGSIRGNCS